MQNVRKDQFVMKQVVDLLALARKLRKDPQHKRLAACLERVMALQSCTTDLASSEECVQALKRIFSVSDASSRDPVIIRSLFESATSLYARAVGNSGSEGRPSAKIEDALPVEYRPHHRAVLEVRNSAVAHIDVDKSHINLHLHRLYMIVGPDGGRIRAQSGSWPFHPETMGRLEALLPLAREIVLTRLNEATSKATRLLDEAAHLLPISECFVDVRTYFLSAEDAFSGLKKMPRGSLNPRSIINDIRRP